MKVLVTGASGFAGRRLLDYLAARGISAVGPTRDSCDLRDLNQVECLFTREAPDTVVHLAARVNPGTNTTDEFSAQYAETTQTTMNVARALNSRRQSFAIFCGSIEEYGVNASPFHEEMLPQPNSAYGWAKVAAYHAASILCREKNIPMTWLRPSLLYGPGMSTDRFLGALVAAHVNKTGLHLTACEQTRDFLFIDDFCEMIFQILERPEKAAGQILNLSTDGKKRLLEAVSEVQRLLGKSELVEVGRRPYRENEVMNFYNSGKKIRDLYPGFAATPFAVGLKKTIEGFLSEKS